ncbi:hypothetical protein PR202_gb25174 [Eleusine coracana subsp. coracana]|uniref:Uncharacterized protein n=1 Tax=Eleusine coracana subsp. coracana TaxID=191504 RepID=A0AAV5FPB2_ELECO|nr:hypothetical protein PR202_gb25174 [Eleusine coracana subsp. coracana]
MMLLDDCFLVQFMESMCPGPTRRLTRRKKDRLMVKVHTHIDDISRDILLLENQIPWSVLQVLMEMRPSQPEAVPIHRFLDLMASAFEVGNEKANNSTDLQQGHDDHQKGLVLLLSSSEPPDHLLDLFYRRQVGAARTQELFVPKLSSLSSTAVELAEMGVKLTAHKTKEFGDTSLQKRKS